MHGVHPEPAAARPPALLGRRAGAFLAHVLLFVVVVIGASRFIADLRQETVPAAFRGVNIDLCDVISREAHADTSICFRVGDTMFSSTSPDAPVKILLPAFAVMFLNSVVLATMRGASLGMNLFGIRVVRRDTGVLAGADRNLLRWLLWLVDGFAVFLVGVATTLTTTGQRRVGDLVAGTCVVAEGSVGTAPVLAPAIIKRRPAATTDGPQWDAALRNRVSPDPQPGVTRQFDDVAPPPRPLT